MEKADGGTSLIMVCQSTRHGGRHRWRGCNWKYLALCVCLAVGAASLRETLTGAEEDSAATTQTFSRSEIALR